MAKRTTKWNKKFLLGFNDDAPIYLSAPSWDCSWYWGFGYLGNNDCHYHLDGIGKGENTNMFDAIKKHFGDTLTILTDKDLWTFCELVSTAYALKTTAEILGKGGAHYTSNPCESIIKNVDETTRINDVVLPAIFDEIYLLLSKDVKKLHNELTVIDSLGLTSATIDFMMEKKVTPDDIRKNAELTKDDKSRIHSAYYERYYADKKK